MLKTLLLQNPVTASFRSSSRAHALTGTCEVRQSVHQWLTLTQPAMAWLSFMSVILMEGSIHTAYPSSKLTNRNILP